MAFWIFSIFFFFFFFFFRQVFSDDFIFSQTTFNSIPYNILHSNNTGSHWPSKSRRLCGRGSGNSAKAACHSFKLVQRARTTRLLRACPLLLSSTAEEESLPDVRTRVADPEPLRSVPLVPVVPFRRWRSRWPPPLSPPILFRASGGSEYPGTNSSPCLTGPTMAIPPGTYRERLRVHEEHEARAPPLWPAHTVSIPTARSARSRERCDRPTDRFLASTAALNTFNGSCWIPRVPVLPLVRRCPSCSLLLFPSARRSVGLSSSSSRSFFARSSSRTRSFTRLRALFTLPRPGNASHERESSAAWSSWVCDSRSLTRRQRDAAAADSETSRARDVKHQRCKFLFFVYRSVLRMRFRNILLTVWLFFPSCVSRRRANNTNVPAAPFAEDTCMYPLQVHLYLLKVQRETRASKCEEINGNC